MRNHVKSLREYSVPLVLGACFALTWADLPPEQYHAFLHDPLFAGFSLQAVNHDLSFSTLFLRAAAVTSCLFLLHLGRPGGGESDGRVKPT